VLTIPEEPDRPDRRSTREAFAVLLWREIAAAGYRQRDMAPIVGITEKHLSQMLNLKVGINPDIADRILAACGRRLVLATEADSGAGERVEFDEEG
jgi:hypothetical protein